MGKWYLRKNLLETPARETGIVHPYYTKFGIFRPFYSTEEDLSEEWFEIPETMARALAEKIGFDEFFEKEQEQLKAPSANG